jgi:formylglycine-generating enzyme required for sulfatase activity
MKWGKILLVIVGAVIVTTLGIDAADTFTGSSGTLLSRVIESDSKCPAGMVEVEAVPGITCVDIYEVSVSTDCPIAQPKSMIESYKNAETPKCLAVSLKDQLPWSYVTRDQALQLCARSGKRLPTSAEWYGLSLGMADVERSCNVDSKNLKKTGEQDACVSPGGVHDLVGNVWEWVSDDVINGTYNNRDLPESGYVAQTDNTGVALVTDPQEQEVYGKDYFWTEREGSFGMVRGGYYDSGSDAGIYSIHADTPSNAASIGIGFRCVL